MNPLTLRPSPPPPHTHMLFVWRREGAGEWLLAGLGG